MRSMLENATWPLRKLFWKIEEKVLWPIADRFRRLTGRSHARARIDPAPELPPVSDPAVKALQELVKQAPQTEPPLQELERHRVRTKALRELVTQRREAKPVEESQTEPVKEKKKNPLFPRTRARMRARLQARPRLGTPGRELTIVLITVAAAAAVGIGVAKVAGGPSVKPATESPATGAAASVPNGLPQQTSAGAQAAAPKPSTLQGVAPDFKSRSNAKAGSGSQATTGTSSDSSSIPAAAGNDVSALDTARAFAGAFVLYEVGKSNPKVRHTFAQTATPALAKALRDRPPRLPDSVKVPTAKVQNVVLGAKANKGAQIDASVSLLRLGAISELRLTLIRHKGTWFVSEVRG